MGFPAELLYCAARLRCAVHIKPRIAIAVTLGVLSCCGNALMAQENSPARATTGERWRLMKRRALEQQSAREDEWVKRKGSFENQLPPLPQDFDAPRVPGIRGAALRESAPGRVFQDLSLDLPSPDSPDFNLPAPARSEPSPRIAFQPDNSERNSSEDAPYPRVMEAENRLRASLSLAEISPHYEKDDDRDLREFARSAAADWKINEDDVQLTTFPRQFPDQLAIWEASQFSHYPLYFEDPALERYGHTLGPCLQPFASVGRWTGQLLLLPYHMTVDPICTPVSPLGWYRPGECTPQLKYRFGWNPAAAAVEAGAVTGLIYFIP